MLKAYFLSQDAGALSWSIPYAAAAEQGRVGSTLTIADAVLNARNSIDDDILSRITDLLQCLHTAMLNRQDMWCTQFQMVLHLATKQQWAASMEAPMMLAASNVEIQPIQLVG